MASDLCPPSRQVRGFVNEDIEGKPNSTVYGIDQGLVERRFDDWLCISKMQKIADHLSNQLHTSIRTRDVGVSAWYYKSCQSLVARFRIGLKHRFKPDTLMSFLKHRTWNLKELADTLRDIDEIDDLAKSLKSFTSTERPHGHQDFR